MCIYYTILETHNILKNKSSEQIKKKWTDKYDTKHFLRNKTNNDLKIPEKPLKSCTGFMYSASKPYNLLPTKLKETFNSDSFKLVSKEWLWKNIPSF